MVDKPGAFMASRPTVIDARHTFKSYQAAFLVIQELSRRDAEAVVELLIKNDKGMLKDIATWCSTTGYQLIGSELGKEEEMQCLIQKGEGGRKRNDKVMTVVISTAGLEEVVYWFDRAIGGSVLGMRVNVCFEGKGVRAFTAWTEGSMKKNTGWPLPQHAIGILEELGAEFYVCGPSMAAFGVREEELVVKNHTLGGTITWVDLLARSNVSVFSKAVFEKP